MNDPKYGNDPSLGPVNGAIPTTSGTLTITGASELNEAALNIGRVKSIKIAPNTHATLEILGDVKELILEPHSSVKVTDLNNYVFTNPSDQNKTIILSGEHIAFDDNPYA